MARDVVQSLVNLLVAPPNEDAFNSWLELKDAVAFLKENANSDDFVVYANGPFTFLHAVLVRKDAVDSSSEGDFLSWDFNAYNSWGVCTTFDEPRSISIKSSLDDRRNECFQGGEQLVFARSFDGRLGDKHYYEVLQKFLHVTDLHFISERSAYCRIGDNGDIENVVTIVETPRKGGEEGFVIITFKKWALDQYAALTDSVIVRTFDFMRFRKADFGRWKEKAKELSHDGLIYRLCVQQGNASYMRGSQIIRTHVSKESLARLFTGATDKDRKHASFIAHDWRHDRIAEISCAPDQTVDYYTTGELPYELSPAFFRPDVLLKYKADLDKYQIRDRSITCRGAWCLEGFDINEAGQVHAYICDLRNIPYEEQLYWRAYNELPKGSISKRALINDFEGNWHSEYDPLTNVKQTLRNWNESTAPWWTMRGTKLFDQVQYPVTASSDEWSNELLRLDQLVIEGFETKWLKKQLVSLGRTVDAKWASLKCIEELLVGLGFESENAKPLLAPFQEVHMIRSKTIGHASGDEAVRIKQQVLTKYGSYKDHFRHLCSEIDEALKVIADAFRQK